MEDIRFYLLYIVLFAQNVMLQAIA